MNKNQKRSQPLQSGDYPEVDMVKNLIVRDLKIFSDLADGSFEVIHRGRRTGFCPIAPVEYFDHERARTGKVEKYPVLGYYNNGPVFKTRLKNIEVLGGYKQDWGFCLRNPKNEKICWANFNYSDKILLDDLFTTETILSLASSDRFYGRFKKKRHEGNYIFFGGRTNAAHFIWEFLSRIPLILDELKKTDAKIIASLGAQQIIKSWFDVLDIPNEKVMYFDGSVANEFENITIISCPFRRIDQEVLSWHPNSFFRLRERVRKKFDNIIGEEKTRLFISRNDATHRRMLNEKEFTNFLQQHGFQTLILSEMKIEEQLALVVNAEWFISSVGAGSALSAFAPEDANVVEITEGQIAGNYNGLPAAVFLDQAFYRVWNSYERASRDTLNNDFYGDLDQLKKVFNVYESLRSAEIKRKF